MVTANQPDIIVVDKQRKQALVIDVTILNDINICEKDHKKHEK